MSNGGVSTLQKDEAQQQLSQQFNKSLNKYWNEQFHKDFNKQQKNSYHQIPGSCVQDNRSRLKEE